MRYFMYSAVFDYNNQNITMNFGNGRSNGFPTGRQLKELILESRKTATNIVILSVCELSEEDYKTFFSDL